MVGFFNSLLLLIGIALLAACDKETKAIPPMPVTFAVAETRDVPVYREYPAQFEATKEIIIRPQVTGLIVAKRFADGSIVQAGQALFEIDPRDYRTGVAAAQGQLAAAQANAARAAEDVARYEPLVRADAVSRQVYDTAVQAAKAGDAQVKAARAGLDQAELALSYTTVRAPMYGQIGSSGINIGSLVSPNGPELARVSNWDPIYAYFSASEQDLLAFGLLDEQTRKTAKENIELTLADDSVYPLKGSIDFVDRALDPTTGSFRIRVVMPNPKHILRPGMYARVHILFETKANALIVPDKAIIDRLGSKFVLVIDQDNKIEERLIKTGPHVGADWIVLSGLQAGERVVVEGTQKAVSGTLVAPERAKDSKTATASDKS